MANATLLIVEDNQAQQLVYEQLCEKFDYDVVFCSSGEDALEALKLVRYAGIIIDLKLPGMDGVEFVSCARAMEAGSNTQTPIIALTASLSPEVEKAFRAAGVCDFMTKPFAIDDFRKMLLRRVYQPHSPNLKLLNKTLDAAVIGSDDEQKRNERRQTS